MSLATGKSAPAKKKGATTQSDSPAATPTTSSDFLRDAMKVLRPSSRKKSFTEDEVLEAIDDLADKNKKAIEAAKKHGELLKEAEKKAREKQTADDERKLKEQATKHAAELKERDNKIKELEDKLAAVKNDSAAIGEEPDLTGLTDQELAEYDKHSDSVAADLLAMKRLEDKAKRKRLARRFAGLM